MSFLRIQEEREERHKYKHIMTQSSAVPHTPEHHSHASEVRETNTGSFDTGDPNTTNLYLGNLSPKVR